MQVSTTITYNEEDDGFNHEITLRQSQDEFYATDYLRHFRELLLIENIGVNGIAVELPSGEVVWDDPFYN